MNVELTYDEAPYFEPKTAGVFFSGKAKEVLPMERKDQQWSFQTDLPPGEYRYRFLLDGELELTDPHNNLFETDENDQSWSVLLIDEAGQRRYNPVTYTLRLEEYALKSSMAEGSLLKGKKSFLQGKDKLAAARLVFKEVTGLHTVTGVWYTPEGELYQYAENTLYEDEEEESVLWFWLDLESLPEEEQGVWKFCLFVDGDYLMEDLFTIYGQQRLETVYQTI